MKRQFNYKNFFILIVEAMMILLMIISVGLFWVGFHHVDLSYNYLKTSFDKGLTLYTTQTDSFVDGSSISYNQEYMNGMNQMRNGFVYLLLSVGGLIFLLHLKDVELKK